jgi:hypothetical protein
MTRHAAVLALIAVAACNAIAGLDELDFQAASATTTVSASSTSSSAGGSSSSTSATAGGGGSGILPCEPGWAQRAPLTIDNTAAEALPPGYQVMAQFDAARVFPDVSDPTSLRVVRVAGMDCETVPTFVERIGSEDYVWFAIPEGAAPNAQVTDYWIYAGHADPPPLDPANVFLMWEPFDNPALTGWAPEGTPSVSGGILEVTASDAVRSLLAYPDGYAIDTRMAIGALVTTGWIGTGWHRLDGAAEPWILWISRGSTQTQIWPDSEVSSASVDYSGPGAVIAIDAFHIYSVERHRSNFVYRYDNGLHDQTTFTLLYTEPLYVRLNAHDTGIAKFDFARVRYSVSPAPTVSVGDAEDL